MFFEIAVVVVLTVLNGLLAMSELAVVSSRQSRLRVLEREGSAGAGAALRLAEDPGRFLSFVQIGITLVGVLSGAYSGATLGARLAERLEGMGLTAALADTLGVGAVVVAITYLSLIVGELVPKQIALRDPERVAARVAPAMRVLSRVAAPLVWLLDTSGKAVLRLLGQAGQPQERVTEEEVRSLIAEAESAGVLETEERDMISGVMRLADRTARALMTPRRDVELLDLKRDFAVLHRQAIETRRSHLPVQDGERDEIVGVLRTKDLFSAMATTDAPDIRDLVLKTPVVADTSRAIDVLNALRASTVHMALVFDEHGHFEGIITSSDVLEAITGAFQEEGSDEPAFVLRDDGSFLVSGWMPIDEFAEKIGASVDPDPDYETVAGLVLHKLNRLPEVGESFQAGRWRFEVVDLDMRRIDKVLVSRLP
ncbi:MAG: HlyC/CorC family transporter [Rhodobacteraceae bacterium]|nr:HlyC/CorC family transporter [Paracoccaceae bacterium]